MTFKQRHLHPLSLLTLCLCLCLASRCEAGTEQLSNLSAASGSGATTNTQSAGARTLLRVYDECTRAEAGFVPCLKKKAISFIDRLAPIDAINVADGIKLVRLETAPRPTATATSENELLESSLPRSGSERDAKLTNMLTERLSYFFNGHSLQVSFPKLTSDEIGRGLEEGRGKMKKMMGMMMMGMAMKMMGMIPIAMGALYILAGKALIISKIALLLAGIIGLKKLMSGKSGGSSSGWSSGGGGGGGGGGWSSGGGGGGGGGWDRRSLNEAQDMAYRAHKEKLAHPQLYHQQQQQQQHQHQQQLQPLHSKSSAPQVTKS
ncbi:uncharacterized protein DMAD_10915 [Drosophila madeirensis]|uniref:Protein osiris 12 n=1 Tax=Drosophila madeirensis TaxID=30013 RepID=A0AAU9FBG1_DROMD